MSVDERSAPSTDDVAEPRVRSLTEIPLLVESNRRHLQADPDALADWTAAQLVKAGAAVIEDGMLVDR